MKKRAASYTPRHFASKAGMKQFTPLSAKEIASIGGRNNLQELEERDYPMIQRMAMYMPERFIAGVLGISESTFNRMKLRDPQLVTCLEKGKSNGVSQVGRSLAQMAMSKKFPGCTIFYMKTQGGMKETVNVQATQVPAGEDEIQEALRKLEPEALRRIAQELHSGAGSKPADGGASNTPHGASRTRRKKSV